MANFSLPGEELSIESIKNWYDDHDQAIKDFKNKVVEAIVNSKPTVDLFNLRHSLSMTSTNIFQIVSRNLKT